MTLDETVFFDICKALGAMPEPGQELRRRGSPRFQVDREISIKRHGVHGAASRAVTLLDISASGVCFVDRMTVSAGDQVVISLPMSSGGNINVVCTVRQSRLGATGAFRIGAEFSSRMEQDTRFVRGVEGVIASSSRPRGGGSSEGEVNQPATMRLSAHDGDAMTLKVQVQSFRDGLFNILSAQPVAANESIILEFHFAEGRIQLWRCVVTQTEATGPGRYTILARNEGAVAAPGRSGGLRGWLRRHFGAAG